MASGTHEIQTRAGRALIRTALPACLLAVAAYAVLTGDGIDFDANIWQPGKDIAAGRSPYPAPELAELVKPFFLYPPLLLGLSIPFSALPHDVARGLFFMVEVAAVVGALRLVDVKDRRVYVWALLSYPVFDALLLGNPTLLLLLALAVAWRWRDQWWIVGLAVGLAGALKLLVWPLGVWLIATRRFKAAALAAAAAASGVLLPWALLGFDGLGDYAHVADLYTEHNGGPRAISIANLAQTIGLSAAAGEVLRSACGLALLGGAVVLGLRRTAESDWQAYSLVLVAALVLSPVVWIHYLALLLIALAIARPSFDRAWIVVCALWVFPLLPHEDAHTVVVDGRMFTSAGPVPTIFQLAVGLGFMLYLVVLIVRRSRATTAG